MHTVALQAIIFVLQFGRGISNVCPSILIALGMNLLRRLTLIEPISVNITSL